MDKRTGYFVRGRRQPVALDNVCATMMRKVRVARQVPASPRFLATGSARPDATTRRHRSYRQRRPSVLPQSRFTRAARCVRHDDDVGTIVEVHDNGHVLTRLLLTESTARRCADNNISEENLRLANP